MLESNTPRFFTASTATVPPRHVPAAAAPRCTCTRHVVPAFITTNHCFGTPASVYSPTLPTGYPAGTFRVPATCGAPLITPAFDWLPGRKQLNHKPGCYGNFYLPTTKTIETMISIDGCATPVLTAYPSPVRGDDFMLELGQLPKQPVSYTIEGTNGTVFSVGMINDFREHISVAGMPTGIYNLKLGNGQKIKVKRL